MTPDEYWYGDNALKPAYRELHRLRTEEANQKLWMQGLYVEKAFEAVISAAFGKKGTPKVEYPKTPYRLTDYTEEEKAAQDKKKVEEFRAQLDALCKKMKKKHAKSGERK